MNDDLRAALDADTPDDNQIRLLLRTALSSRVGSDEGRYCECPEPELIGAALMCFRCERRNRSQEVAACHRIADAHAFTPDRRVAFMCGVCTMWEDDPRHRGVPAQSRTSWGELVQGVVEP